MHVAFEFLFPTTLQQFSDEATDEKSCNIEVNAFVLSSVLFFRARQSQHSMKAHDPELGYKRVLFDTISLLLSLALQLMYACADAGLIFVPLNTRWAINELRHAVIDSGIKVMAILDREFVGPVLELSAAANSGGPGLSWVLVGPLACDSPLASTTQPEVSQWRKLPVGGTARAEDSAEREERRATDVASGTRQDRREHEVVDGTVRHHSMLEDDVRDVFCIMHTSGSTGRSKGVALTHLGQVRSCPLSGLSKGARCYICSTDEYPSSYSVNNF